MFTSIMESITGTLTIEAALACTVASLVFGLIIAVIYMSQSTYSKNYILTLVLLPAMVQVIIMLVNGNLGTGVAIMGAFGLVRFRSMPGSAKEICGIFFAMTVGVATGMGYLTYAAMFTLLIGLAMFIIGKTKFGEMKREEKQLKITIPENLDYTEIFEDIFDTFTISHVLDRVKTTNMGSMYELSYQINLKEDSKEKEMIDALRTRNGNLTIVCGRPVSNREEL